VKHKKSELSLKKASIQENMVQYEQDPADIDSDDLLDFLSELSNEVYSIFSKVENYQTNCCVVDKTMPVAL